jgi:dihydroorotase
VTSPDIDLFDREAVFIEQQLIPLLPRLPRAEDLFGHITAKAAQYVQEADRFTAATLTAHHLLYNRNAIFTGGIRPPTTACRCSSAKRTARALVQAATSGSPKFFLGTDSAPHPAHLKEHASGCAGCYTAHAAIRDVRRGLRQRWGARQAGRFRQLPRPGLLRPAAQPGHHHPAPRKLDAPEHFAFGEAELKPLRAGEALPWKCVQV